MSSVYVHLSGDYHNHILISLSTHPSCLHRFLAWLLTAKAFFLLGIAQDTIIIPLHAYSSLRCGNICILTYAAAAFNPLSDPNANANP
jgi:hypothetical protein